MNDLISVIIPSYNRKNLIVETIDSVLKQDYSPKEIIVIDDGSKDGTYEFLKNKYADFEELKVVKNNKNSGAGFSRKRGFNMCNGEYIVFLDDDDYYTDFSFFTKAIKLLKQMPNVGMISASSKISYTNLNKFEDCIMNIKGHIKNSEYLSEFQQKYMKSNSTFTTVFKKKTLIEGNLDDVEMVNDSSIYLRALLAGDAYILEDICGVYRVHSSNMTFTLNIDFIIENLIEKRKVYDEIVKLKLLDNPGEWLKKQVELTLIYLVENNDISSENFEKLVKWCEDNCEEKYASEIIDKLTNIKGGK